MKLKLWYWLCVVGSFLMLDLRIYYIWSRIGQWLFERKFLKTPIKKYLNAEELHQTMSKWVWRKDPWWQLGDMFSCPALIEHRASKGEPIGDCDEFAIYASNALKDLFKNTTSIEGKLASDISILTVTWMAPDGKAAGHNVCAFKYLVPGDKWYWAWVSNWFDAKIQWTKFDIVMDIVKEVVKPYKATPTRWALASPDLKSVSLTGGA